VIDGFTSNPDWNTGTVKTARLWVVILSWVEVAVFGALAAISMLTGCCCPDNEKRTI
jgi:hypothetical protein